MTLSVEKIKELENQSLKHTVVNFFNVKYDTLLGIRLALANIR